MARTKTLPIKRKRRSRLGPARGYVRRFYQPTDPMWVIGCIDSNGSITARHAEGGKNTMHTVNESRGKRWRWSIWGQEYQSTLRGRLDELTDDELAAVTDWLERKGYKSEST